MKNKKIGMLLSFLVLSCLDCVQAASVLLIGDSVSQGYAVRAQNVAGSRHVITHIGENGIDSGNGVLKIDDWLNNTGTGQWDIIHFNFGLHDVVRLPSLSDSPSTPGNAYQDNLRFIISKMKEHSPQATIIFAMITPILPQSNRLPEDVEIYNNLARQVMTEQGVRINDLYTPMLPHLNEYSSDGTHFTPEGNQFNAERVVEAIDQVPEPSLTAMLSIFFAIALMNRSRK